MSGVRLMSTSITAHRYNLLSLAGPEISATMQFSQVREVGIFALFLSQMALLQIVITLLVGCLPQRNTLTKESQGKSFTRHRPRLLS